jgi:hypothetical protein
MYMFDEIIYLCWVNLNFIIKKNELKPDYLFTIILNSII